MTAAWQYLDAVMVYDSLVRRALYMWLLYLNELIHYYYFFYNYYYAIFMERAVV